MSRPSILSRLQDMTTRVLFGAEKNAAKEYFGHLIDTKIDGSVVTMSSFVDNKDVLCVVNVASQWGLTKKNYTQLTKLVDEYGDRGFKVLAFPCNQFGGQEPVSRRKLEMGNTKDTSSLALFCFHFLEVTLHPVFSLFTAPMRFNLLSSCWYKFSIY